MIETSTKQNDAAVAKCRKLLADAAPMIVRLMPHALALGDACAFLVRDPAEPASDDATESPEERAARLQAIEVANGGPVVIVLPVEHLMALFAHVRGTPMGAKMLAMLTTGRRPDRIPVIYTLGPIYGAHEITQTPHGPRWSTT